MKWACVIGLTFGLAACNGAKAPENTASDTTGSTGGATNAIVTRWFCKRVRNAASSNFGIVTIVAPRDSPRASTTFMP